MKYQLTNLIKDLTPFESRNFKSHSNRFYQNEDKKFTQLYDVIRHKNINEYDKEICKLINYTGSEGAFARLKNHLTEEIENSLLQLHRKKHSEFKVYRNLQLYQLAWDKSKFKEARDYLKKAQKIATKIENYELLNLIVKKTIQICPYLQEDPTAYIEEQVRYHQMMSSLSQLDHLLVMINYKIVKTNFLNKNQNLVQQLEEMSKTLLLDETFRNSAEVKLKIYQSIRNVLLQKKDFEALAEYLMHSYDNFEQHKIYSKKNHEAEIVHVSWIINALLKIKRYKKVPHYSNVLFKCLFEHDKAFYHRYIWQYYQSRMLQYTFSGENTKAIDILLSFEKEELHTQPKSTSFYLNLNLCSLNYTANRFNESLYRLANILADAGFNKLNEEFQLRILIMELIIRTDNGDGDVEYILNRIREIKRKFNPLLKENGHIRDKEFIKIIEMMLKKATPFKDEKFLQKVNGFIKNSPEFEPGSNEVIDYAIWLKSKIESKTYYELIPRLF